MLRRSSALLLGVALVGSTVFTGVLPTSVVSAAAITSDDFTSGTLDSWTTAVRVAIDNTSGDPAAPSARAAAAGQSAYAAMNLAAPVTDVCFSANVNVASGNNIDLFRLRTAANGPVIKAYLATNGTVGLRNDFGSTSRGTTTQLGAGWHNLELCGTVGAATTWDLYRDGVAVVTDWQTNTGTTGVGRVQIGDTAAKTFTANFDHVVVDQAPGDEDGTPADTTPPTVPGTPTGSSSSPGTIQITWAASADPSTPISYRIYRDGSAAPVGTTTTLAFTDVGLPAGSSHTYTVDAVDAAANASAVSAPSAPITVQAAPTDTTAPTVPGTPSGTSTSASSIQLSWTGSTDPSTPITYRIYRDAGATPVGQTTSLSYTDTGLAAGSSHTYTVDAVDAATNASAQSASSASITVQSAATGGLVDEFANLSGWTSVTRLTISTTAGSPAAPSARAQVSNQSASAVRILPATMTQACISVNVNLASGSNVDLLRLRTAANGALVRVFVASNGTIQMRNDINSATRTTTTQLGAGWHNVELCGTVGAATSWTLYRDSVLINTWQTNSGSTPIGRVQLGTTSNRTFTANFDHFVVDNAPGDGGVNPGDTTAPTVPGVPTGTSPSASSIALSWTASTDASAPITYRVYRDGGATPVGQTTNLSFTDTGLAAGSSHTYSVDATDPASNASAKSAASASITVQAAPTDTTAPTVPGRPAGTSPSSSSIQLGWAASTDASSPITYRIYRDGGATAVGQTTSLSFTDTGLAPGSSHTYTVDATDPALNASAKSQVSLTITVLTGGGGGIVDEFADFAGFSSVTRLSISTTAGSPAAPSARAQVTNQSAFAVRTLPATMSQACVSVNVNIATSAPDLDLLRMRTAANGPLMRVFRATSGALYMRNDLNPASRTTTTQLGTGWHNIELCGTIGAATSWTLYRDGVLVNTWQTNTGTTPIGLVQLGSTTAKTFTANYDHFVVDTVPGDGGAPPTDTTAPTVPGPPAGTSASSTSIQISWAASTDDSTPITYRIYRDGAATPVGQTTSLTYTDTGLTAGTSYTYTVDAVDPASNASAKSAASSPITVANAAAGLQPVPGHTRLANDVVQTNMPRITDGEMWDIEYIGTRVFIAGGFTSLRNNTSTNTTTVSQRYLAAFDINTGLIDTNFRPTFDGGVTNIEASPDGTKLFVVGSFNTVNGVTKRKIASINPTTGATITTFTAQADAAVSSVDASNTTVYVGGRFTNINGTTRVSLAALSATTGAVVTGFQNDLAGGVGVNGALTVQALKISHDGTKLLVVHTGTTIAGQTRLGIGLINTTNNQLLPWRTRLWDDNLQFVGGITRIYAGDIAPNDQYFVVSSGSGGDRPPISDTVVAYPIAGNDDVQPLWISRAFDSVYSVAITEQAVYIGGHFNYNESPTAPDPWPGLTDVGYGRGQGLAGYGLGDDVVIRDHTGALSPATGKAVEWNPGSDSFEGNKAMLVFPRGIIMGGDALTQGDQTVGRVAFYDFNAIPAVGANETTLVNPIEGRVEEAGVPFTIDGKATAASGVNRVQVEVRDRDTNRYLQDDLVTWAATGNTINATLSGATATTANWSLTLNVPQNRRLMLYAKTFGTNGTSDSSKATKHMETFGTSDATPTTNISGPSGSVIPTTTFTVTGTASDDVGVNAINFTFRDSQDRYLQANGTTSSTYNSFRGLPDVIGATSATWSYEVTVPYEGNWTMQAIAVDTAGQSDLRSADRTWLVSDTAIAPTVEIATPTAVVPPATATITLAPGAPVTFSGTATDDEGLDYVAISLRNTATGENLSAGGAWGVNQIAGAYRISGQNSISGTSYNWSYTTPFNLSSGTYSFVVGAIDDLGISTTSSNQGRITINVQVPGDAFPNATITPGGTINGVQVLHLDLTGSATDDIGVSAVRVALEERDSGLFIQANGALGAAYYGTPAVLSVPNGTSTNWTLSINLPTQGDYSVTAVAFDTSQQQDPSTSGATSRYPIYPGDQPPTVTADLLQPTDGTVFTTGKIFVSGRLEDDQQIAQGQVAIRNGAGQYMSSTGQFTSTSVSWRSAFLNSPGSLGSNFSYTTPSLASGSYVVLVRGVDQHGFATAVPPQRTVSVTGTTTNLPPVANFTYSCASNVCTFDGRTSTDEAQPTLTYSWNFGSGSGSGPVPTKTYTAPGTYTVTLTVRDENNLTGVTSKNVTIVEPAGNSAPVPVIGTVTCAARTCVFPGNGTTDPNTGDTISYLWAFGDNPATTSTSTSPSKTYTVDGVYTVSLTATDGWGKSATVTKSVTIAKPATNHAPVAAGGTPVCVVRTCNFFSAGTADQDGDAMTYLWSFGDTPATTSTSATPTKTYTVDGTYNVTLVVTDAWGDVSNTLTKTVVIAKPATNHPPTAVIPVPTCVARTCSMSSSGSSDQDGDAFTYLWNFGDATATSTASAPSHTFPGVGPYTVTLTLTDAWGDPGVITREITFTEPASNVGPTAVIDTPVCTARSCTFSASTSSDPNGDAFTYLWSFGDTPATTSTLAEPTKNYTVDATYTVSLTLTDAWGKAGATVTKDVTILKPANNAAPTAVISTPVCNARVCSIPGVSSSDPNGDAFTYLWTFSDVATTVTTATASKTYTADGTYTVTLKVTDAWGDFNTAQTTITIAKPAGNLGPTAVIGNPQCNGRFCSFSSVGSSDPEGNTFTYVWAWGDATANGTTANPTHTFAGTGPGTFTVTLTLTDGWGTAGTPVTRTVTFT